MNTEYTKIETLYDRDEKFNVMPGKWRLPEFEYLANLEWVFTEKIDGTNIRIEWSPLSITIRYKGRTDNAQMPTFLLAKLQEVVTTDKLLSIFPDSEVVLYGEGYGAKIQKGGGNYIPNGVGFILFDILINDWWLKREEIEDIAMKLGIPVVPIVGRGTLNEATNMARGYMSTFGNFQAEGLVVKPKYELSLRNRRRLIGKIKARDFGYVEKS